MYANAETFVSLPAILTQPSRPGPGRRLHIGEVKLSIPGMARFNRVLARLGHPQAVDRDQMATAARILQGQPTADPLPPCIALRMEHADALARMLSDREWVLADGARQPARDALAYVQANDGLIPDCVPQVGRLDDAMVIEAVWPQVRAEVLCYLDFCRLRLLEATLRGAEVAGFCYSRRDWEVSRAAEATLHAHHNRVRKSSYVGSAAAYFRVR